MTGRGTPVVTAHDESNAQSGAPYYVKALALGLTAYLLGVHLWIWVLMASFYLGGHSDFRQIYATAQMVRSGTTVRVPTLNFLYSKISVSRNPAAGITILLAILPK